MQKNKKMFSAILLSTAMILSGCTTGSQSIKNGQSNSSGQGKNSGQSSGKNQSDYVVDESDYVNAKNLIANIERKNLSEAEKAGLIQMREEEKLARDVYNFLYKRWEQNIFANIAKSEQTHTDSIKVLLDNYGIADPSSDDTLGVFTSAEMQSLYKELVEKGSNSLADALAIGATVEDLDIKDLEDLIEVTDNEDIKIVYQNLMKGSRNHLRAFVRQIERIGGSYSPQYISQEEYQSIIDSEQEKGNANSSATTGGGMNSSAGGKNSRK